MKILKAIFVPEQPDGRENCNMVLHDMRAEWIKLRGRRLVRIMPVVIAGILIAIMVSMYLALRASEGGKTPPGLRIEVEQDGAALDREATALELRQLVTLPGSLAMGTAVGSVLGLLLMVVLAAEITGNELKTGTACQALISGQTRTNFVLVKVIIVIISAFIVSVASVLTSLIMGGLFTRLLAAQPDKGLFSLRFAREVTGVTLRLAYMLLPYSFFAAFAAIAARNSAVGIMVPLASFMLVEPILGQQLLPLLGDPWRNMIEYLPRFAATALQEGAAGAAKAAIVLLGYCILFVCLTLAVFRKRDVSLS